MGYMFLPLKRYADFSGRSRRLEFWLWALFNWIVVGIFITFIAIACFNAFSDLANRAAAGEFTNYVPPDGVNSTISLNGEKYAVPPEVLRGNPTGAGDAAAAAFAVALRDGVAWPEALAEAVALSGAAVVTPVAGEVDLPTYARLRPLVIVKEVPCHW